MILSSVRVSLVLVAVGLVACGGSSNADIPPSADAASDAPAVHSQEDAKLAYLGLDGAIDKAIALGFKGFNAASSANIPTETANGDRSGTIAVDGHVDQGGSSNKTMNLTVTLKGYSDGATAVADAGTLDAGAPPIIYDSSTAGTLSMKLDKIPTGTLTGSLDAAFVMTGPLTGTVTLAVTFTGALQAGAGGAGVERKPGTTHIIGTAVSGSITYPIDVTR